MYQNPRSDWIPRRFTPNRPSTAAGRIKSEFAKITGMTPAALMRKGR